MMAPPSFLIFNNKSGVGSFSSLYEESDSVFEFAKKFGQLFEKWRSDLKSDGRRPPSLLFSIFCNRGWSCHQNKDDLPPIFSFRFVKVGGGAFKIGRNSLALNLQKWVSCFHKKKERQPFNFMMVAPSRSQINLILVKRGWSSSLNWGQLPPLFWFFNNKSGVGSFSSLYEESDSVFEFVMKFGVFHVPKFSKEG